MEAAPPHFATNDFSLCGEVDIPPSAIVEVYQANILQGSIPNCLQTVERSLLSNRAKQSSNFGIVTVGSGATFVFAMTRDVDTVASVYNERIRTTQAIACCEASRNHVFEDHVFDDLENDKKAE